MSTDAGAGAAGGNTPANSGDDVQAELQRLREENSQYSATLGALEPYADDIRRFVQDENYRNFVREGSKYYEQADAQRKPQLSPEMQIVLDTIREDIKPQREMVERYNQQQQSEVEARKTRAFNEGKLIVQPYLDQHPELRSNRAFGATLDALQQDAVERDVPFKEVWDNYMGGFSTPRPERKAPPASLRANDGEVGIPAAQQRQQQREDGRPMSIRDAVLHIQRRGKAS